MKTLYIDASMGAAGDMLTAALLELVDNKEEFVKKLNSLGIPGVEYKTEISSKCGINGTHVRVEINGEEEDEHMHHHQHHEHEHHHEDDHHHDHDHEHDHSHHHHHSSMHDIEHIVRGHLDLPENVKDDVMAVYGLIAEAESHAHGMPVEEIHFHEVGTMDAVADVVAVCMLMNELKPAKVVSSSIHVGAGTVKCAHGILPVPAPATAYILKDVPIYGGKIKSELCTPTGAALLKHFVNEFADMPEMRVSKIGYGMGKKDFEVANCVRVMIGETKDSTDKIVELSCNIDDMNGEMLAFACEELMKAGCLDVHTIACSMKKGRNGVILNVLCKPQDKERMVGLIFKHTTTIGIRESLMNRYVLKRHEETVNTEFGPVRKKVSEGYGVTKEKYEYEDLAQIAKNNNCSINEVLKAIK